MGGYTQQVYNELAEFQKKCVKESFANPKVSIIVPIYNVEPYIEECLDSLIGQTLKELEFICIDDGSTDNSFKILEKYAECDARFVIINQSNQGQGIARNNGIKIAKGEYIAFVDPDDWVEKNAMETLYNFAKKNNTKIIHFNYSEFNEYSGKTKKVSFLQKIKKDYKYNLLKSPFYNFKMLKRNCLAELDLHVWTHFYNSQFIKENNIQFAPSRRGEDHLFAIGAKLLTDKIYYLNEYLYFYRCRAGSAVNTKGDDNFLVFENIDLLEKFIKNNKLWDEYREEFASYKIQVLGWHYNQTPDERVAEYETRCRQILSAKEFKKMMSEAKKKLSFAEFIFSIKNRKVNAVKYKIITILGFKFQIAPKEGFKECD